MYSVDINYKDNSKGNIDLTMFLYKDYELIYSCGFESTKDSMEKDVLKECKDFLKRQLVYNQKVRIGTKQRVETLYFV
jgi:hypothetical protein